MNLIEVIEKNAANTPDKTGLCDLQTSYTFWKMLDESKQMAARFQSLGIRKGGCCGADGTKQLLTGSSPISGFFFAGRWSCR